MKKYYLPVFSVFMVLSFFSCVKDNTLLSAKNLYVQRCGVFLSDRIPDETCPEWKLVDAWKEDDIRNASAYKTDSGLRLGVWYYWGQLGMKAWECRLNDIEGRSHECMFSMLMEDGVWTRPTIGLFVPLKLTDFGEKEMPVLRMYVRTKDGSVVQRTFMRPK